MKIKDAFRTMLQSLNPGAYKALTNEPFQKAINNFIFVFIFSFIILGILLIPLILSFEKKVDDKLNNFQALESNWVIEQKNPVNILNDPLIKYDENKENLTNEMVLINNNTIQFKKFIYFGKESTEFKKNWNFLEKDGQTANYMYLLFIFMLPSIIFWLFIVYGIKYIIFILITALLAIIITRFFSGLSPAKIFKAAAYSSTIMILLEVGLMPYYRLFTLTIALYVVFFIIVLIVIGRDKYPMKHKKGFDED